MAKYRNKATSSIKDSPLQITIYEPYEKNKLLPLTSALLSLNELMQSTTKRYNELCVLIQDEGDESSMPELIDIQQDIYQTHKILINLFPFYAKEINHIVKTIDIWMENKDGN